MVIKEIRLIGTIVMLISMNSIIHAGKILNAKKVAMREIISTITKDKKEEGKPVLLKDLMIDSYSIDAYRYPLVDRAMQDAWCRTIKKVGILCAVVMISLIIQIYIAKNYSRVGKRYV